MKTTEKLPERKLPCSCGYEAYLFGMKTNIQGRRFHAYMCKMCGKLTDIEVTYENNTDAT